MIYPVSGSGSPISISSRHMSYLVVTPGYPTAPQLKAKLHHIPSITAEQQAALQSTLGVLYRD